MRSFLRARLSLALLLVVIGAPVMASADPVDPIEAVRQHAAATREALGTPGAVVVVVDRERPLLLEALGHRDAARGEPTTVDTRFLLASATKAFTATALGVLVDEGRLAWDRPVIDALSRFRLADDHATLHVSLRDLLAHRSGLATHPFVFYRSTASRASVVEALRHLEMGSGLRERFQYSNLGYLVAGEIGARAVDGRWEDLIRARLFEPLGMVGSGFADDSRTERDAVAHRPGADGPEAIEWPEVRLISAAGGVVTTARDLVPWLRLQLSDGSLDERRLVTSDTLAEIQAPQAVLYGRPLPDTPGIPFVLYGLGWNVGIYRGHRLLWHAGAVDGFGSLVAVLPDAGYAIAVMANESFSALPATVVFHAIDPLLGLEPIDPVEDRMPRARRRPMQDAEPAPWTRPAEAYVGTFEHPAYGELTIDLDAAALRFAFRGLGATLVHRGDERFAITGERALGGLWARFGLDANGTVDWVDVPFAPAVEPIVFRRVDNVDHGQ